MNIDRHIEEMKGRLERSKPALMTAAYADGRTVATDVAGAWELFRNAADGEIVGVAANRGDYAEIAGLLTALCRRAHG